LLGQCQHRNNQGNRNNKENSFHAGELKPRHRSDLISYSVPGLNNIQSK
jgi:hypothetical protein